MGKRIVFAALVVAILLPCGAVGQIYGGGGGRALPGIALTDTLHVAVGRELNIWNGQLAKIPYLNYPFFYSTVADSGQAENRGYRFTPTGPGSMTATIRAYDYGANLVEQNSAVVSAVWKNAGAGQKKVLFVGDSMFDDGGNDRVVAEVDSIFGVDGGGDTVMIGTQTSSSTYHEAHSGKSWAWFSESTSPFWDAGGGRLDFPNYSTTQLGGLEPDYVVINLGGNESIGAAMAGNAVDAPAIVTQATAFLDSLLSSTYGYPSCRVAINLMPTASGLPSAFGASYNAEWDPALYFKNIRAVSRALVAAFDGGAYSNRVDVCAGGLWVDPDYGYPVTSEDISARYAIADPRVGLNFVHPTTGGYQQLADALYSHLRYFHELDAPTGCTNELLDSENLSDGVNWSDITTYWVPAGGQSDPWGGATATKFTATAAVVTVPMNEADRWQQGGDIVFSVFVKNGNLTGADKTEVQMYNDTDAGIEAWVSVTWATPPTLTTSVSVSDGDLEYLGDGWYRAWGTFDNTTEAADDMFMRIYPCPTTAAPADEVYLIGGQLEFGVTEPCGIYIVTP